MITRVRDVAAMAIISVLAACASNSTAVKPVEKSAAVPGSPTCPPQTGSRINSTNLNSSDFVRCHSKDEIVRTGDLFQVGHALTVLDPAVTVSH